MVAVVDVGCVEQCSLVVGGDCRGPQREEVGGGEVPGGATPATSRPLFEVTDTS